MDSSLLNPNESGLAQGVYVLDAKFKLQVSNLRHEMLSSAHGFTAKSESLIWSDSDSDAVVLGIIGPQGTLISTMRLDIISSYSELARRLDFDDMDSYVKLPVGLLGKAATHSNYQGQGLNTYLRYLSYKYFLSKNIYTVVGTVVPGAPRLNLMRSLGYQFIENPHGWRRYGYTSEGKTLVATLDLKLQEKKYMNTYFQKLNLYPLFIRTSARNKIWLCSLIYLLVTGINFNFIRTGMISHGSDGFLFFRGGFAILSSYLMMSFANPKIHSYPDSLFTRVFIIRYVLGGLGLLMQSVGSPYLSLGEYTTLARLTPVFLFLISLTQNQRLWTFSSALLVGIALWTSLEVNLNQGHVMVTVGSLFLAFSLFVQNRSVKSDSILKITLAPALMLMSFDLISGSISMDALTIGMISGVSMTLSYLIYKVMLQQFGHYGLGIFSLDLALILFVTIFA